MSARPRFPRSALRSAAVLAALVLAACSGDGRGAGPQGPPEPPRVTGFDPVEAEIGAEIRVLGRGFGADPEGFEVRFGLVEATVVSVGGTSAVVRVPEVLPGAVPVVVSVDGRTSEQALFTVLGPAFRPPDDEVAGRWERTLIRTEAEGACPDALAESRLVGLRIENAELSLGEASGAVQLDGTWTASGALHFEDGSSVEVSIEARFTIESGRLAIVGELVRVHHAPDGSTTCAETYDLRLDPA